MVSLFCHGWWSVILIPVHVMPPSVLLCMPEPGPPPILSCCGAMSLPVANTSAFLGSMARSLPPFIVARVRFQVLPRHWVPNTTAALFQRPATTQTTSGWLDGSAIFKDVFAGLESHCVICCCPICTLYAPSPNQHACPPYISVPADYNLVWNAIA